jgi:hypothetical protein
VRCHENQVQAQAAPFFSILLAALGKLNAAREGEPPVSSTPVPLGSSAMLSDATGQDHAAAGVAGCRAPERKAIAVPCESPTLSAQPTCS